MLAKKRFLAVAVVFSMGLAAPAWAVQQATVEAVVSPAWIERHGQTQPLAVGMAVANGHRIRTGDGARVYLKLAEGSTVKLGADATLAFFSRSLRPQRDFKGALDVLEGAFRFTTDALRRVRSRDVSIRVGTATAGIRGTDVWGRATAQQDLVCLLDGAVELRHAGLAEALALTQANSCLAAAKGQAPEPVSIVAADDMRRLARETEIEAGAGAQRGGGQWQLLLGRHADQAAALEQYDLARSVGYAPRIRVQAAEAGGWDYAVTVTGFADEVEAAVSGARLKLATGIEPLVRR